MKKLDLKDKKVEVLLAGKKMRGVHIDYIAFDDTMDFTEDKKIFEKYIEELVR